MIFTVSVDIMVFVSNESVRCFDVIAVAIIFSVV